MNLEILPLGDNALLINFDQQIDPEVHQQVVDLSEKLTAAHIRGIIYVQPAYCSLTIGYDHSEIEYQELKRSIQEIEPPAKVADMPGRSLVLPVCYQAPYNLDLSEISKNAGLSEQEIIRLHTTTTYRVYLLGFLPGFPYLGVLPEQLHFSRRAQPRIKISERSVGIAGKQTGIYPSESPGGWNILGRTPLPIFRTDSEHPFLFKTGDQVKFEAINSQTYTTIRQDIEQATFDWQSIYE